MIMFQLEISYGQLTLFDSSLTAPFNDWTDAHVAQGFAWRPGSVSFATLGNRGSIRIEVFQSRLLDVMTSHAERIIVVPFSVPEAGAIGLASIGDGVDFSLPPGEYQVTFEHGRDARGDMWGNLYFRPVDAPAAPRILRVDADLHPPTELVMTAEPA